MHDVKAIIFGILFVKMPLSSRFGAQFWRYVTEHTYCWNLHQAVETKPDPIIANSAVFDSSHIHSNMIEGQNKHFTWWGDSQLDFIGWDAREICIKILLDLAYCWDLQQAVGTKPDPIIANSAVFDSSHIHRNMIEGQNKHFRWWRDSQLGHIGCDARKMWARICW